jgi:hypothetical protein
MENLLYIIGLIPIIVENNVTYISQNGQMAVD